MPDSASQPSHQQHGAAGLHGHGWLERISRHVTDFVSGPWGTLTLIGLLVAWAVAIPVIGWTKTYRAVVDLVTVASFILLILIQRSQSKAMLSLQVKLNELLAAVHRASPQLINVEDSSESEVREIHDRFQEIQQRGPGAHSISDTLEAEGDAGPGPEE
jgi:low affinity Fe/Cu permease